MTTRSTLDIDRPLSRIYDTAWKPVDCRASQRGPNTTDFEYPVEQADPEVSTEDELDARSAAKLIDRLGETRHGRWLFFGAGVPDDTYVSIWEIGTSLLSADWMTEHLVLVCADRPSDSPVDWDRWHDLLDIRDREGFTPDEQVEYDRFAQIVAKLDAEDAAVSAPAVEALVKKHERVLASIEQLTKAVRAAADRV